jgi:hypothetical protein
LMEKKKRGRDGLSIRHQAGGITGTGS